MSLDNSTEVKVQGRVRELVTNVHAEEESANLHYSGVIIESSINVATKVARTN